LVYSGVLPIGADNVTNDLAIGLRVSLESAEDIKIALSKYKKKKRKSRKGDDSSHFDLASFGINDSRKISKKTLVEGIIRPRLNEIFTMVRLQLEKEELSTRIPSGVVITGGGAETIGVIDSAKRMMSLPAKIGIPKGVGGLIDDIINPTYAVPVGLILYAVRHEEVDSADSFASRFKFSPKGVIGKMFGILKDLLP
jgi:cell division protein FtsA